MFVFWYKEDYPLFINMSFYSYYDLFSMIVFPLFYPDNIFILGIKFDWNLAVLFYCISILHVTHHLAIMAVHVHLPVTHNTHLTACPVSLVCNATVHISHCRKDTDACIAEKELDTWRSLRMIWCSLMSWIIPLSVVWGALLQSQLIYI